MPLFFWFELFLEARAKIQKDKSFIFWCKQVKTLRINWPLPIFLTFRRFFLLSALVLTYIESTRHRNGSFINYVFSKSEIINPLSLFVVSYTRPDFYYGLFSVQYLITFVLQIRQKISLKTSCVYFWKSFSKIWMSAEL